MTQWTWRTRASRSVTCEARALEPAAASSPRLPSLRRPAGDDGVHVLHCLCGVLSKLVNQESSEWPNETEFDKERKPKCSSVSYLKLCVFSCGW